MVNAQEIEEKVEERRERGESAGTREGEAEIARGRQREREERK